MDSRSSVLVGVLLLGFSAQAAAIPVNNGNPVERAESDSPAFSPPTWVYIGEWGETPLEPPSRGSKPHSGVYIGGKHGNPLKPRSLGSKPHSIRSNSNYGKTPATAQRLAKQISRRKGFEPQQWACLKELWQRESGWRYTANNPTSSAYGIAQVLKTPEHYKPLKQIRKGLGYISHRYGTPCRALQHHNEKNWY